MRWRTFRQDDARYLDTYWHTIPGIRVHGDLAVRSADGAFVMMGRSPAAASAVC